jgi:periplasmic divalent cation tolerance protein
VTGCCQVTTTLPDQTAAKRLGDVLVGERLAACAQILGPLSSTYRWQGTVQQASEFYCHLKTTMDRLPALQRRIRELHPYEVPEIVTLPIIDGDTAYLQWITEAVSEWPPNQEAR